MNLVDKEINIKANPRNIQYYLNLGYDIKYGSNIDVKIVDLPKGSSIKIDVYCDLCHKNNNVQWSWYYKSYTENGYYCCNKCKGSKIKKTNLKKYGSTSPLGNKDILDKLQKTNLEKYGNVCSLHGDDVKKKVIKTFNKNWGGGIGSHMNDDDIKNKIKNINIEKYGIEYPTKNKNVSRKIKETNLEKYGVENIGQLDNIKNKIKNTHKEKYGDWFFNSDYFDRKSFSNNYYYSDDHLKSHYNQSDLSNFDDVKVISYKGKSIWELKCNKGHVFNINRDLYSSRKNNNIPTCLECVPLSSNTTSLKEKELFNYINSVYSDEVKSNYRDLGFEIDIYIPRLKIGFEFNGLYWHSDLFKDKNYHKNKTDISSENGIELIHIWEDEWVNNKEIILSIINNKLGIITNKIYARETKIKEVHYRQKNNFLDNNHIQGKCRSSLNYGLYLGDELVSLMTFGKRNINNKVEFELIRFCNKINTNVIGGASKLFKYFIKNNNFDKLISYSDNSKYSGELYNILNFNKVSDGILNYYWTDSHRRYHRFIFNKKKLIKEGYDPNKTENEIMKSRGYNKIWSCGHKKWEFKL